MAHQILTYKFRLYPNATQTLAIEGQLREAARLYNAALQERRDAWSVCRKRVTFYDQQRQLKYIRANNDLAISSFMVASDVLHRVDAAFSGFFRRAKVGKAGYPRFRSHERYDSIRTKAGHGMYLRHDRVSISGVGSVRFKQHRDINGKVKTIAVKREGDKWFVIAATECQLSPLQPSRSSIGIDVGLTDFAALSSGEAVRAPRFFRRSEATLRRAQRHLARCGRNSNRRRLAKARVRAIHASAARRRADFSHKLSRQIVNQHGLIAVERLNITGMASGHFAKSIHDAGWRIFLAHLAYKAANAGRQFVEVKAAGTSQTCVCGALVPKGLSDRWHACDSCGLSVPRDVASAMVIEQRGRRWQASTEPLGPVACEVAP